MDEQIKKQLDRIEADTIELTSRVHAIFYGSAITCALVLACLIKLLT